jgi:hypothetical protein
MRVANLAAIHTSALIFAIARLTLKERGSGLPESIAFGATNHALSRLAENGVSLSAGDRARRIIIDALGEFIEKAEHRQGRHDDSDRL